MFSLCLCDCSAKYVYYKLEAQLPGARYQSLMMMMNFVRLKRRRGEKFTSIEVCGNVEMELLGAMHHLRSGPIVVIKCTERDRERDSECSCEQVEHFKKRFILRERLAARCM